jgi:hypothetical protein
MGRDWHGGVYGRQRQMDRHGCLMTHVRLETSKEREDSCLHIQGRSQLIWDRNSSYRADGGISHRWLHLQGLPFLGPCSHWTTHDPVSSSLSPVLIGYSYPPGTIPPPIYNPLLQNIHNHLSQYIVSWTQKTTKWKIKIYRVTTHCGR